MSHVIIKSIPIQTRIHRDAKEILARDRARAQKLLAGLHPHGPRAFHARKLHHPSGEAQHFANLAAVPPAGDPTAAHNSIDVTDAAVTYTLPVKVGQETFTLIIDTGSSNTWVGANKKYKPTSTSKSTGKTVTVTYGSGSFSGTEYTDQVSLGGNLTLKNQSIGVASKAKGFDGVDGILGIGPVDLTTGTVKGTQSVPTVTDSLYSEGLIPTESIAISFNPTTSPGDDTNGELTFGATDTSKFNGSINYVPITATSPASHYWGVDQTLTYGSNGTPLLQGAAGIVDTGTTLILIATDAFQAYQQATQATLDQTTGLLTIADDQFAQLESLFFQIGSVSLTLFIKLL